MCSKERLKTEGNGREDRTLEDGHMHERSECRQSRGEKLEFSCVAGFWRHSAFWST